MGKPDNYDFCGWATKNNIRCADGLTIRQNAFAHCDGEVVPIVYQHDHRELSNVLGHALLENRPEGVYAYGTFNKTERGQTAKEMVSNGDLRSLSIWADQLQKTGSDVMHGTIREVSLVLAGANRGAKIEQVIRHSLDAFGDDIETVSEDEVLIHSGEEILYHSADITNESEAESPAEKVDIQIAEDDTVGNVLDKLGPNLTNFIHTVVGLGILDAKDDNENEGDNEMKHSIFESQQETRPFELDEILAHAIYDCTQRKAFGSLRQSIIANYNDAMESLSDGSTMSHSAIDNISDIQLLFPEFHEMNTPPKWIKDDDSWVNKIMSSVHHTPYSKVRATFGKLDEKEARARGYIKGTQKVDLKLAALKRETSPTTVYIRQAMDRDDVIDITDFNVLAWQRNEMRGQMDAELARAFLLGDGRPSSDNYKINPLSIRPIFGDDSMYTIEYTVKAGTDYKVAKNSASDNDSEMKGVIRAARRARKTYKGSGKPTFFTTEDLLNDLLNIEDQNGRIIYETEEKLAAAMRCKEIVTVPPMEGEDYEGIYGIIVNFNDYNVGADKGGALTTFEDFDIDFNQMKYLMETRVSGALVQPYSAIVLKKDAPAVDEHAEGDQT